MEKKQGSRERDLEYIAGLIREGYTSGFEPVWYIDITGPFNDFRYLDNELKDIIEENIAYVVKGGYESYVGVEICIGVDEFSEEVVKSLGFDDDDIKDARESDYPELSFYVDYDLNYEVPYDEYDEEKGGSGVDCEEKVANEDEGKTFGFAVDVTVDEEEGDVDWEKANEEVRLIERNVIDLMKNDDLFLMVRDEGHSDGAIVGTVIVEEPGLSEIEGMIDIDDVISTGAGTFWYDESQIFAGVASDIYYNVDLYFFE